MDKLHLEQLAEKVVHAMEVLPYPEARKRAAKNQVDTTEVVRDGKRLQVEVQYFFDSGRSGSVRVVVSVDDGGTTAFLPVTRDTIISEGQTL